MRNKRKWQSILLIGLVLLLASSVTSCAPTTAPEAETPPATPPAEQPATPPAEQPAPTTYTLSVSVSPSEAGSVSPLGGVYEAGTQVTLTATATSGYTFDYWDGDASGSLPTITITMDSDKSVIAHFSIVDTTPPVISGVGTSNITETSVTVKWETDEAATSHVEYGKTTDYGLTATLDKELATSHSVTLTELKPETTYHFRIKSVDEAGNEALSKDHDFTTKTTEELLSAMLYPAMTIGSYVHQLSFNLFNGSSQTITVTKVEIFDEHGDVAFTMSKSDIAETWGSGKVKPGNSLSASISFQIPPSTKEIEDWQVKWHCIDANGVKFTVKGKCKAL